MQLNAWLQRRDTLEVRTNVVSLLSVLSPCKQISLGFSPAPSSHAEACLRVSPRHQSALFCKQVLPRPSNSLRLYLMSFRTRSSRPLLPLRKPAVMMVRRGTASTPKKLYFVLV